MKTHLSYLQAADMHVLRLFFVRKRVYKTFFAVLLISVVVVFVYETRVDTDGVLTIQNFTKRIVGIKLNSICERDLESHSYIIEKYYEKRRNWTTSNLGSILFKNIRSEVFRHSSRQNRTFVVLVWKHWDWLRVRHVRNYKSERSDPLEGCSVKNCIFSGNDTDLNTADAVLVHVQKGFFPKTEKRNPNQRWVFLTDEAPGNQFSLSPTRKPKLSELANMFNWTMTYRSDSDVPVPYGRTIPLPAPILSNLTSTDYENLSSLVPNWELKRLDALATVLISNCGVPERMNFLKDLRKHIPVEVYGKCSDNIRNQRSCPGHFTSDCSVMSEYIFYIALENSYCRQYITEKSFYHAYSKGAIPVIMGPPVEDCKRLLPPNSYLHVDDYKTVEELAQRIKNISASDDSILEFHRWRNNFEIVNEHGYFGSRSFHLCRLCEALNYNDGETSVYDQDNLELFFDEKVLCKSIAER